ncbi:alcohol dehydrogenase [Mycobacterium vulneris]|uniref:Alcohol dehydrogenase catalytic domain-containing protein n=1 Tax=Mycolicibacterium septicum DSM 44393 TaxID=1341646 RepID=A0A7X6MX88_9MYCO|nr:MULTISPECIES: zinc-binding dehydrogenase [Mycolicibacterium]MBX8689328.1 alcohol dehydrogenase catalytic domain-containing protein [Mycobacterium sp. 20091114027_K0903767]OCB44909.1 alcohol dehydrogenase [Mycolicibacterium vulneris]NKZ15723.1 alcohol dehydrogenase catalytic domain-containing protein [Mycolicibacterium septicum DSM 44393]OBK02239.1 alcohol dehydrogenase [Mycolicibacterium fortuitum]OBK58229.1 alcohol dehydrogenase [Mycolicibacterium fortuitum]
MSHSDAPVKDPKVRANAEALILARPRTLQRRRIPVPDVGPDNAILRVEACGLCGTDHEQFSGHLPAGFAFIPGHEIVGVIETIGASASARWGVRAGQRVAVEVFRSCRACDECRRGDYRRCERNGVSSMFGFVDVCVGSGLWGGYSSHVELPWDAMLLPIPPGINPVHATLFNPLGAGIRWGATLPGTAPGDVVAILGCGIRGICAAVGAKEAGAAFVVMTGVGPRDNARLAMARSFGVDTTVDVAGHDPLTALLRATGGRHADVVIDVTAKAPSAFADAVALARVGGTVVVAGTRGGGGAPGFEPDLVVYKELRIIGSLGVDYPAYQRAFEVLASRRWPFEEISRRIVGYSGLDTVLGDLADATTAASPALHNVFVPD